MKLVRFGPAGQEKPGLMADDGTVRDLSAHVDDIIPATLGSAALLTAAREWRSLPVAPAGRLGPPLGQVGKFIGIGLNYADHAAESGQPIPKEPIVFFKATTSICGPNDDVVLPPGADALDWEVELGFVIGKEAYRVGLEEAAAAIYGYLVVNDISERKWQLEMGGSQWSKGKSHDTFGPLGPWLVTADEVPDPGNLELWLTVNGETMQRGSTRSMIFSPAQLVADLSTYMRLLPGDVVTTGTPPGVGLGMKPPRYLRRADVMELGIEGLGSQRQKVV